jgi:hypothetical protein
MSGGNQGEILPALIIEKNHRLTISLKQVTSIEAISLAQPESGLYKSQKMPLQESTLIKANSDSEHGIRSVLHRLGIKLAPTDILKIETTDGKAALTSLAELESDTAPLVVPHRDRNKYDLEFPGDRRKARSLEGIDSIEIISLKQKPMMYVVGVGCGDLNLLTNEAISIMAKADAFVGKEDYQRTFAGIAGKEHTIRTVLSKAVDATDAEKENFLGLIYVGRDLRLSKTAK